jgi:hypothetical protein
MEGRKEGRKEASQPATAAAAADLNVRKMDINSG